MIRRGRTAAWLAGLCAVALALLLVWAQHRRSLQRPRPTEPLAVVLEDLLTYAAEDSPVAIRGRPPDSLWFSPEVTRWGTQDVFRRLEDVLRSELSEDELGAVAAAAADLERRPHVQGALHDLPPLDPRIRVAAPPGARRPTGYEDRPIRAAPPSFSADGRYCVIVLSIPWSMHSASGTYVLSRERGDWQVLARRFVYYP